MFNEIDVESRKKKYVKPGEKASTFVMRALEAYFFDIGTSRMKPFCDFLRKRVPYEKYNDFNSDPYRAKEMSISGSG